MTCYFITFRLIWNACFESGNLGQRNNILTHDERAHGKKKVGNYSVNRGQIQIFEKGKDYWVRGQALGVEALSGD